MKYSTIYMRKYRAGEKTAKDNGLRYLINTLKWKPVPGFPGYLAAKEGYILSGERIIIRSNGKPYTSPATIMKPFNNKKKPYRRVHLSLNGNKTHQLVHRLVYLAWNGPIPDDKVVDHIDNDVSNNSSSNLQLLYDIENLLKERRTK